MTLKFSVLTTFCSVLLTTSSALAEVPVVDDSENYTLLNEQIQLEQPVSHDREDWALNDTETFSDMHPELDEPLAEHEPLDEPLDIAPDKSNFAENPEPQKPLAYDMPSSQGEHDNAMLLNRFQTLQEEIQQLRGQLEVQAHDLKLLQQQQLAFYKDLDARLSQQDNKDLTPQSDHLKKTNQEAKAMKKIKLESLSSNKKTNPADEQISYLKAYELIKSKKYDDALSAMNQFVYQYPQSGYTPNAEYWLGELYMVNKQFEDAIEHFELVLKKYPTSSKLAPSLLKLGYALAATGNKTEAREKLNQVIKEFPDTQTAQLATAKLATLK